VRIRSVLQMTWSGCAFALIHAVLPAPGMPSMTVSVGTTGQ
jgi:hypothetical protein